MLDKSSYLHLLLNEPVYLIGENPGVVSEKEADLPPVLEEEPKPAVDQAIAPTIAVPISHPVTVERKPLGVMVHYPDAAQFPEAESVLLANILKAVGFDMDTVEMIFVENAHFQEEQTKYFHKLIGFGLNSAMPPYQIHKQQDCQVLMSDSLAKISADVSLKKQLWVQLQSMFGK